MSLLKRMATTLYHPKDNLTTTARRYFSTPLAPPPGTQHKQHLSKGTGATATTAPGRHDTKKTSNTRNTNRKPPLLCESLLQETFIKGSGPGGQKINKVKNKVVLVHVPTNIQVSVQKTRSLTDNRRIARKQLTLKVQAHELGEKSFLGIAQSTATKKKLKKKNRARRRKRQKETEGRDKK